MKTAVFISSERSLRQWRIRLTVGAISKSRFQIQGGGETQGIIPQGLPRSRFQDWGPGLTLGVNTFYLRLWE